MSFYKVPAPLFQQMANYLSHQPYRDVAPMLNEAAGLALETEPADVVEQPAPAPAPEAPAA